MIFCQLQKSEAKSHRSAKGGFLFLSNHTLLFACPYPVRSFRSNCIRPLHCISGRPLPTDNEAFQSVNHPVQANEDCAFMSDLMIPFTVCFRRDFLSEHSGRQSSTCGVLTEMSLDAIYSTVSLHRLTFKAPNVI